MRTEPTCLLASIVASLAMGCASSSEPTTSRSHVVPTAPGDAAADDAGAHRREPPTTPDAGLPASDAGVLPEAAPLPCGRTYDQDRAYFEPRGDVSVVTIEHRDGTTLPATEGSVSCGSGCTEAVTRLGDGASLSGVITAVDTFSVQAAVSGAAGVGTLVVTACGETLVDQSMAGGSATSTPGFVNLPNAGAWNVPEGVTCAFTISARGGHVDLRAVTTSCEGGPTPPPI